MTVIRGIGVNPIQDSHNASTNNEDSKGEVSKSKKHFYTEIQGKYYCTYLVDEAGSRSLISRVPASQALSDDSLGNADFKKALSSIIENKASGENNSENERNAYTEASHKVNREEMLQLLQSATGIPSALKLNKVFD